MTEEQNGRIEFCFDTFLRNLLTHFNKSNFAVSDDNCAIVYQVLPIQKKNIEINKCSGNLSNVKVDG